MKTRITELFDIEYPIMQGGMHHVGYAELAADHELILGVLDNHWDEGIMAFYDYLVKNYPVDTSRVYLTGFSAGGNRATWTSLKHPELFAGILVGAGLPFYFEYDESLVENAAKYRIPMIGIGGTHEKGNTIPFSTTNPVDNPLPEIVARLLGAENKVRWANALFKLNQIVYLSLEGIWLGVSQQILKGSGQQKTYI